MIMLKQLSNVKKKMFLRVATRKVSIEKSDSLRNEASTNVLLSWVELASKGIEGLVKGQFEPPEKLCSRF